MGCAGGASVMAIRTRSPSGSLDALDRPRGSRFGQLNVDWLSQARRVGQFRDFAAFSPRAEPALAHRPRSKSDILEFSNVRPAIHPSFLSDGLVRASSGRAASRVFARHPRPPSRYSRARITVSQIRTVIGQVERRGFANGLSARVSRLRQVSASRQ